jgi:hypothetical protein
LMIDGNVNFDVVHDGLKEMKIVYPVNREKSKNYIRERKKKKIIFSPDLVTCHLKNDTLLKLSMCQCLTCQ